MVVSDKAVVHSVNLMLKSVCVFSSACLTNTSTKALRTMLDVIEREYKG